MAIEFGRLRRIGASARNCIVAGALACALAPGLAFAADGLVAGTQADDTSTQAATSATDKLLATLNAKGELAWPDGHWAQTADQEAAGTYIWDTFVKGDNAHYGHYDLVVTYQVDPTSKELQSVNLESKGTTFGGKWGVIAKSSTIVGALPDGVSISVDVRKSDDTYTITPTVSGTDSYGGFTLTSLDLYSMDENGKLDVLYERDTEGNIVTVHDDADGDDDPVVQTATLNADGTFTTKQNDQAKVARLNVKIGAYYQFSKYVSVSDDVTDEQIAQIEAANATDYDAPVTGIGSKDRDMWTQTAFASIFGQQLDGFLNDEEEIDIVTSATKSSHAIMESMYASQGIYYPIANNDDPKNAEKPSDWNSNPIFTSVSPDLALQLDGKQINGIASTVKKDADGNYVLAANFSEGFDFIGSGNAVNAVGYDLYDMSGSTAKNPALFLLQNAKSSAAALTDDATSGRNAPQNPQTREKKLAALAETVGTSPIASVYSNTGGGKSHAASGELTAEAGKSDAATYDPATNELTITDPHVTHAIVWYNHDSHGNYAGVVYDLAATEEATIAAEERAAAKAKAEAEAKAKAAAAKAKAEAEYRAAVNPNAKTLSAAQVKKASNLGATTITLGKNVKKIAKNAFKGTKVKTVVITSTKLKKSSVKNAFKGSKVKTVKVNVGSKKQNKKFVKKYKKFFTKAVLGKSVKLKAA